MITTLTFEEVREQLKDLGITLKHTYGPDLRVNYPWGRESTAYYTESLDDALEMGRIMAEKL